MVDISRDNYGANFKNGSRKILQFLWSVIKKEAEICPKCGVRQHNSLSNGTSSGKPLKSKIAAGLFALFLGGIGVHKFYLGNVSAGVLYLLFFWTFIPAFIAFIEGIIYLTYHGSDEQFTERYAR